MKAGSKWQTNRKPSKRDLRIDRVFTYICEYIMIGYAPSVRDICEGCDIGSTSTAHGYLKDLEKQTVSVTPLANAVPSNCGFGHV